MRSDFRDLTARVRSAGRRFRRTPGEIGAASSGNAHPAIRRADRELIIASGVFDQGWVEAQLRRSFDSLEDAVDAYLTAGDGVTPHPLFYGKWIPQRYGGVAPGLDRLVWYLSRPPIQQIVSPHPLIDIGALIDQQEDAQEQEFGPFVAWLRNADDATLLPTPAGTRPVSMGDVRRGGLAALEQWHSLMRVRRQPRISPKRPLDLLPAPRHGVVTTGEEPLISVIMPVWNRAVSVRRSITSVQAQTFGAWELLVVDDGSDDDSAQVVRGISHFDPRVRLVPREHAGVSRARNAGIEQARGKYVAFLDSDNVWRREFLAVMASELEQNGWQMAHAVLQIDRDGRTLYRALEGTRDHLLVTNHVDLNVLVARTDLVRSVGGFDHRLRRGVDYDLVLKLAEASELHLVPYVGVEYDDTTTSTDRITTTEPLDWFSVISSNHLVDWDEARARERVTGLTSVVIGGDSPLRNVVDLLLRLAGADLDIVVTAVRQPRWRHVLLATVAEAVEATVVPIEVDPPLPATCANIAFSHARGERVVLSLGPTSLNVETVASLATALGDPSVSMAQPLLLQRDSQIIASGGAVYATDVARPHAYLAGHHAHDIEQRRTIAIPAVLGDVFCVRGQDLADLGGLNGAVGTSLLAYDLSVRLGQHRGGSPVLCASTPVTWSSWSAEDLPEATYRARAVLATPQNRVSPGESAQLWRTAGFEPAGIRNLAHFPPSLDADEAAGPRPSDQPFYIPSALVRPIRVEVDEATPHLRWTIDLASPSGSAGERWGDTHFGRALARSLERLGQHVCVDDRTMRHRGSRDLDDVLLVLRGLDRVQPRPGVLNLEWIISHPELVGAEEVRSFDRVYAASPTWGAKVASAWGVTVHTLLQATDPALFHPRRAPFDSGAPLLFVGNSRGVFRSSIQHATRLGHAVEIHGGGWDQFVDPGLVASAHVDNEDLGAMYAAAGVVLNDHWDDMRELGFVSNRLMDAAASGARIASDAIPGVNLAAMFHGLVQTYESADDLGKILADPTGLFPDSPHRLRAAETVAREHSFDARARVLLDDAIRLIKRA